MNHGLSLLSALVVQSLVLHFLSILLHEYGLNLFLFLTEVFVLEHEHVDVVQIEIKGLVILDLLDLLARLEFQLLVLLNSFLNELVDIDIRSVDLFNLLPHDGGSSMNQNLFVLFLRKVFVLGLVSLLNDNSIQLELDGLPLDNLLLNTVFGDESVYIHILLLTNPMSSVHGLQIDLWIPIRVIENDVVGRHQVDTETTRSGRNKEDLLL